MKKHTYIIVYFLALSFLSGCGGGSIYSNFREIENLQLIQTIGFDSTGGAVDITVSSGKGYEDGQQTLISATGATTEQALTRIQDFSSASELFYAHIRYALLGEQAARTALPDFLDYLERSPYAQLGISMFVVRNASAKNLMTNPAGEGYDITEVMAALETDLDNRGDGVIVSCSTIAQSLSRFGAALIPAISIEETQDVVFSAEEPGLVAISDGMGIIKDAKLVDYLDADEALALCMLQDSPGDVALEVEDNGGESLSLGFIESGFDTKCEYDSAKRQLTVSVSGEVKMYVIETRNPDAIDGEAYKQSLQHDEYKLMLEEIIAEKLKGYMSGIFEKSAINCADFLGLKAMLLRDQPDSYRISCDDWEGILEQMQCNIDVKCEIDKSLDLSMSISLDGERR